MVNKYKPIFRHLHTHGDRKLRPDTHTHTRDNYSNPRCAHARRGLIIFSLASVIFYKLIPTCYKTFKCFYSCDVLNISFTPTTIALNNCTMGSCLCQNCIKPVIYNTAGDIQVQPEIYKPVIYKYSRIYISTARDI